jgi:hypothetical protein
MKAMTVGRSPVPPRQQRPEDANSWGEFNACLERESADWGSPLILLWWLVGVLCFVTALLSLGYALSSPHVLWWLWLYAAISLATDGVLASRGVQRADQARTRRAELVELRDAWLEHRGWSR